MQSGKQSDIATGMSLCGTSIARCSLSLNKYAGRNRGPSGENGCGERTRGIYYYFIIFYYLLFGESPKSDAACYSLSRIMIA